MKRTLENDISQLMVAKIGRPVGLDGKLKLHMMTDFPEQFKKGVVFYSLGEALEVQSFDKNSSVIKFKNIDSQEAATKLTNRLLGATIESTRENCSLSKDEFFWFDMVGLQVFEDGELLGVIENIERYGKTDYFLVATDEKLVAESLPKSFLLPYQDRFIISVMLEDGKVLAAYAKDILLAS